MFATNASNALDQTLIQAISAGIEASINTALAYDPSSRQKIAALSDILAIELTSPSLCFYLRGKTDGVAVLSYNEAPVVTHLSGSPCALLNLLKQPTNLANSGVSLVGSTALLQQWQGILQTLDIDWEEAISRVLGDIAGPLTASSIKSSAQWIQDQCSEQGRLISEYLPEEVKLTPSKPEAEKLFDNIGKLSTDVDRLGARLNALSNKLSNTTQEDKPSSESQQKNNEHAK
jgi:ubiquinone biosynthesis protein UbiJ